MLDRNYYEGFEGEGQVKVWTYENGSEISMVIWIGFFNTVLEGCFIPTFQKKGIVECYFNQNGFYDNKWEMKYPCIVLDELKRFDEKVLDTRDEEIIQKTKEIVEDLINFISIAIKDKLKVYIEYD